MLATGSARPPTGAEVEVRDLEVSYGVGAPVVSGLNLRIGPGEFVTLLGASGSGKTTILRVVAGFLRAASGQILVDGSDISQTPIHKRDMGMVFQSYALFPHLSVEKNVAFPLEMRKVPTADRRELVKSALRAVHLEGFAARKPSALSGGQQQRVAFARAIVASPRVLLMDEPLGALDRRLRESLQLEMLRLSRERGLTVINVTHDQEEAMTMSDKVALLADGRVAQYGTPQELYQTPANSAVAEFLGESNIFRGSVVADGGQSWFVSAGSRFMIGRDLLPREQAALVVRPQDLRLTASATPGMTGFRAEVVETIYRGDSVKVLLKTDDDRPLVARCASSLAPRVGDWVNAEWSMSDAHLTDSVG
ncbi:MAG: ABC transporter ATP-binding protein [Bifidobacteriaceae bacterium]|jgi:putative spermidine/putrescine transport system ATP-binding protein|nr:ABC transporter ATP-binding protein [Bifidobacteriaceae bacterium]